MSSVVVATFSISIHLVPVESEPNHSSDGDHQDHSNNNTNDYSIRTGFGVALHLLDTHHLVEVDIISVNDLARLNVDTSTLETSVLMKIEAMTSLHFNPCNTRQVGLLSSSESLDLIFKLKFSHQ